jgi:hypothetical protein
MMVLITYSFGKVVVGILAVSLALLVLTIAYKKFLAYLGKGAPVKEDYCVLYPLEIQPSSGEVKIYFESKKDKQIRIELLKNDLSFHSLISAKEFTSGGNIVTFDTKTVENGNYFYALISENQKTMKKIRIQNV